MRSWLMLSAPYCVQTALVPFDKHYNIKIFGYCYHLVIVIRYGLALSEHYL
jgi:hypothetical protein